MATRTPLREYERSRPEPSNGLLERAEEPAAAATGKPPEALPWHALALILVGLALLIAVEITLAFGIAKLVTGHAY
jgi:hypothetical protein